MNESNLYRAKRLLMLILLSAFGIFSNSSMAQSREYLIKAGYIEKFTHFVEWPSLETDNDTIFKIAIIGEDQFESALHEIFKNVKVKNRTVQISRISSIEEIQNCLILVISGQVNNLDEILGYTTGKQILTISENKGYGKKGVVINLFLDDNYIRYEINQRSLEKSRLKMSSLLLSTALIVKTDE